MAILVKNVNFSLRLSLNLFKFLGFWAPEDLKGLEKTIYSCYSAFSFMYIVGIYIIVQTGDLVQIWGNVTLMTGTSFLLFTNTALAVKMVNVLIRRREIKAIVDEGNRVLEEENSVDGRAIVKSCDRETRLQMILYIFLSAITVFGWASSADADKLPLRAWYPYDTSTTPAYELTYMHQSSAVILAAFLNVCLDTLVTSLIAQCCCRLRLLRLSLKTLCVDMHAEHEKLFTSKQEIVIASRLRRCVSQHQSTLETAVQLENYFSVPILAQMTVSMIIICVTAYQLAFETKSKVRVIAMIAYLIDMMLQIFLYCYQGNELSEESIKIMVAVNECLWYTCSVRLRFLSLSTEIAGAAYECPWYSCSVRLRRSIIVLMSRSHRVARISAAGFTTLSLSSFMSIIKASYSFFTVLQQVGGKNKLDD